MSSPRSDTNISVLEGVLVGDPKGRELASSGGHVTEASVVTTEHWMKGQEPQERTSYIGLVAHGPVARILAVLTKGTRVWIVGRLCTVESTGPKGGRTTSTKLRVIHCVPKLTESALALIIQDASLPDSNLTAEHFEQ